MDWVMMFLFGMLRVALRSCGEPFGGRVMNEVYVAFLSGNRQNVIGCKTNRFGAADGDEGPGAEALYKLDTPKDLLGGANGRFEQV